MSKSADNTQLHVIMEHFSFEMQDLLEEYQAGTLTIEEMVAKYHEIGTEGHDVMVYRPLLEHAKANKDKIKLHAGFIPRTYAKTLVKEGEEGAIKATIEKDYIDSSITTFEGSDFHYNMFESMISGRELFDDSEKPSDMYRKIFKA